MSDRNSGYGGYGKQYDKVDPEYLAMLERQGDFDNAMNLGNLGLNVAGTGLQGFGAYLNWKQQEADRAEEKRRYAEQQRIAEDERKRQHDQQRMEDIFRFGGYARDADMARRGPYQGYAARVGL